MAQNPDPTSHSIIHVYPKREICHCRFILWVSAIIMVGIINISIYDVLNIPYDHIRVVTTDANITQFDFINNTTLYYNLGFNFNISNVVHKYDYVEAGALYQGVVFGYSILQETPNNSINELTAVFKGHHEGLSLSTDRTLEENMNGVFHITVKLCLRVIHDDNFDYRNPTVRCDLHVPLKSYKEGHRFHATQCDVHDELCYIE